MSVGYRFCKPWFDILIYLHCIESWISNLLFQISILERAFYAFVTNSLWFFLRFSHCISCLCTVLKKIRKRIYHFQWIQKKKIGENQTRFVEINTCRLKHSERTHQVKKFSKFKGISSGSGDYCSPKFVWVRMWQSWKILHK